MPWNPFKNLNKSAPNIKEISSLPKHIKDTTYNNKNNKITIRYFHDLSFKESQDIQGEIIHNRGIPLIIFDRPFEGAILYLEDCIYHNQSKDGELTINLVKDYPFGIDLKSDLIKYEGIEFHNNSFEIKILNDSQEKYYKKTYKFFIPMMLNKISIPIIRLDNADRILRPVDESTVKRLSNISQTFLREFVRLELLKRTGSKKDNIGWIAIFFIMVGMVLMNIISGFML